jgi:hypothetical protein
LPRQRLTRRERRSTACEGPRFPRGERQNSLYIEAAQLLLPDESAISAVTLAELAAGPHATDSRDERAKRQDRLQWATATWDAIPFDDEGARIYGRMFAAARAAGQNVGSINFAFHPMAVKQKHWRFAWERKHVLDSEHFIGPTVGEAASLYTERFRHIGWHWGGSG